GEQDVGAFQPRPLGRGLGLDLLHHEATATRDPRDVIVQELGDRTQTQAEEELTLDAAGTGPAGRSLGLETGNGEGEHYQGAAAAKGRNGENQGGGQPHANLPTGPTRSFHRRIDGPRGAQVKGLCRWLPARAGTGRRRRCRLGSLTF